MKEYLFYDRVSGEEFFVNTDTKEKAYLCAYSYFQEPILLDIVSEWEAEILGYDTYQKGEEMIKLLALLIDIWAFASTVDFFIYYTNCHRWNLIQVLWEIVGKRL